MNSIEDDLYGCIVTILFILMESEFYLLWHESVESYEVKKGSKTLNLLCQFLLDPSKRPDFAVLRLHKFEQIKLKFNKPEYPKLYWMKAIQYSAYHERPFKEAKTKRNKNLTWFSQSLESGQ